MHTLEVPELSSKYKEYIPSNDIVLATKWGWDAFAKRFQQFSGGNVSRLRAALSVPLKEEATKACFIKKKKKKKKKENI